MGKKRILFFLCFFAFCIFPVKAYAITLQWPVPGHTSLYQGFHDNNAIDIGDATIGGANVYAALGGTVELVFLCTEQHHGTVGDCNGFGTGLVIRGSDNRAYQYAHMQANSIPERLRVVGAQVSTGEPIGKVGTTGDSSGNHLHFGVCEGHYHFGIGNPLNETYNYDLETEPPVISNVTVSDITYEGYTVSCTVTDNVGIDRVQFPTWTIANDQDDLASDYKQNSVVTGTRNGNTYTFHVNRSEHNFETGQYTTHIYAFDTAGNETSASAGSINVPACSWDGYTQVHSESFTARIRNLKSHSLVCGAAEKDYNVYGSPNDPDNTNKQWYFELQSDGTYEIKNVKHDMNLDIYDGSTSVGTNIILYADHDSSNQRWKLMKKGSAYVFQSALDSDRVIDLQRASADEGTNIRLYYQNTGGGTEFTLEEIEPPVISDVTVSDITYEGYTVSCTATDNVGIDRVQFPTWTAANENDDIAPDWQNNSAVSGTRNGNTFTFRVNRSDHNFETGTYTTHIYAFDTSGNWVCSIKDAIDVPACSWDGYTQVHSGSFRARIRNIISNSLVCGAAEKDFNVYGSPNDPDNTNKQWYFELQSDGTYEIKNVKHDKNLEIYEGSTAVGANILISTDNNSNNQRWKLMKKGSAYVFQSALDSDRVIDLQRASADEGTNVRLYYWNTGGGTEFTLEILSYEPDTIITLPEDLVEIEEEAFAGLTSAEAIRIPDTVKNISDTAFNDSNIIIIASADSYAIQWAKDHNMRYIVE